MQTEKYKKNMLLSLKTAFMYRENFFISIIMRFIVVLLTIYLWKAIYTGQNEINGYRFTEMILYLFIANFIYGLGNFDDFSNELITNILQGKISTYLLRPASYLKMSFFECLGQKFVFIPIDFIAYIIPLIITAQSTQYHFQFSVLKLFMIALTTIGSMIIGFLTCFLLGMVAFYIENPTILLFIKGEIFSLLSGSILPLDMFPSKIRIIIDFLPMKYMGYYQSSLLLGNVTPFQYIYNIFILFTWIILLIAAVHYLWQLALTKYIANGG